MITQAFVLGAGLGTRLRPLTDDLPKPLVPIFQKPLITFALDQLLALGIENIHINTHHQPGKFAEIFPGASYRGRTIAFHHEPVLLETAGGIANIAAALREEALLVYNGDILSDLPLARLIEAHERDGNLVTLALRSSGGPQHIALDEKAHSVIDIHNQLGTDERASFVFTGIYLVSPSFVKRLDRGVKQSVIPHLVEALRRRERVGGVAIDEGNWWDVGTPRSYLELHRILPGLRFPRFEVSDRYWHAPVHASAQIGADAIISGCTVVGREATVGAGAILRDSIIWPGALIASRSELTNCIVRSRQQAVGIFRDAII